MFAVMDFVTSPSEFSQGSCLLLRSYLLVRHPQVLDKLRSEISSVITGTDSITRTDLKKMTYLTNVLKESGHMTSDLGSLLTL
jgi:hypothetical protein